MTIAAGAMLATSTLAGIFPAAAQQSTAQPASSASQVGVPFTAQQCDDATRIIIALLGKYEGRMSAHLAKSMGDFVRSKCDLNTSFSRLPGVDDAPYGEFRLRMIALRSGRGAAAAPQ